MESGGSQVIARGRGRRRAAPPVEPGKATAPRAPITEHTVLAARGRDAAAITAIMTRHAELAGALAIGSAQLLAAATGPSADLEAARFRLAVWCESQLMPQLAAEAAVLHPAAGETREGEALLHELAEEHHEIARVVAAVRVGETPGELVPVTISLRVTVNRQLADVAERLLPLLGASSSPSLADLWEEVEDRISFAAPARQGTPVQA